MLRVLLLDCSAALQSRLKDQGFRVEAGTVGFCTGVRQLPSQIYEQDVIFYNPESVPKDGTVSKDIFKDLTPQYDVAHLEGRVRDGATFVAFINPISPASMLQCKEFFMAGFRACQQSNLPAIKLLWVIRSIHSLTPTPVFLRP